MTISFKIGGPSIYVKPLGKVVLKILQKVGFYAFGWLEVPNVNSEKYGIYHITMSDSEYVQGIYSKIDVLLALTPETIAREWDNINKGAAIFVGEKVKISNFQSYIKEKNLKVFEIPESNNEKNKTIKSLRQSEYLKMLAAVLGYIGVDSLNVKEVVVNSSSKLPFDTQAKSVKIIDSGYLYIRNNIKDKKGEIFKNKKLTKKFSLEGIRILAAAIAESHCKNIFFDNTGKEDMVNIYSFLNQNKFKFNFEIKEAIDIQSAAFQTIGTGFTGKRSLLIAQSSNYYNIQKAISYSSMIESPLVVFLVDQGSVNKYTYNFTEQNMLSDLYYTGTDQYPKIVLTPGSVPDLYSIIQNAFNMADEYQLPVIIYADQYLINTSSTLVSNNIKTLKIEKGNIIQDAEKNFKRFKITKDGISPRSLPGSQLLNFIANGKEHDEYGKTIYDSEVRNKMVEKRFRKLKIIEDIIPNPILIGDKKSDITLIGYGSTKSVIEASLNVMSNKKASSTNFVSYEYLFPFKSEILENMAKKTRHFIIIENNRSGQFEHLVKSNTDINIQKKILKYNGRPFFIDELNG